MSDSEERHTPSATAGWFRTTHWSVVLAAKGDDASRATDALEKLCRTYWPPLYAFIRRDGYGVADAQDLTQEFFARLQQENYLGHLRDQRGKFRSFLLTFLKHFLSDERAKAAAQKRGGEKTFISLEDTSAEEHYLLEAADQLSPAELFERRWAKTILERALHRLRQEYEASSKLALFDQLKDLQPGEHGPLSYAEVGRQFGMTVAAIKAAVHRLRKRHRELLREVIAQTVTHPEEIDEEIRYLLTVLGR